MLILTFFPPLLLAHAHLNNIGFSNGTMLVGPYAGQPVEKAKPLMAKLMFENGTAVKYFEPEDTIISRSGDECVVALCDQWYIVYGEPEWKEKTKKCLEGVECYDKWTRADFERTLEKLHEYACSRTFGLGIVICLCIVFYAHCFCSVLVVFLLFGIKV